MYDGWLNKVPEPKTSVGGMLHMSEGDAGNLEVYTLGDLQTFLSQFPPKHYTSGGREPLLYVIVLLLSLQFLGAIAFLAKDPSATDFRVDAPHLAIAAFHYKVWPLHSSVFPSFSALVYLSLVHPTATLWRGTLRVGQGWQQGRKRGGFGKASQELSESVLEGHRCKVYGSQAGE